MLWERIEIGMDVIITGLMAAHRISRQEAIRVLTAFMTENEMALMAYINGIPLMVPENSATQAFDTLGDCLVDRHTRTGIPVSFNEKTYLLSSWEDLSDEIIIYAHIDGEAGWKYATVANFRKLKKLGHLITGLFVFGSSLYPQEATKEIRDMFPDVGAWRWINNPELLRPGYAVIEWYEGTHYHVGQTFSHNENVGLFRAYYQKGR